MSLYPVVYGVINTSRPLFFKDNNVYIMHNIHVSTGVMLACSPERAGGAQINTLSGTLLEQKLNELSVLHGFWRQNNTVSSG